MAGRGGLGSLSVFLGLDVADFTDGLTKAEQQAKKFGNNVKAIAAGTAIGQAISDGVKQAAAGLKDLVFGSIDAADHLNDLSKKTGIAVETLGGIGFAAGQAGGDLESATAAAGKLNKSLAEAAAGGKEASEAFKVLGIEVKDANGKTRSTDEVLTEIANKFASFADGPEKAALALRIFGKAGADMIPLLNDGGQALQDNIEYFKRYSGVTTETAQAADQFNDTLGKVALINKSLGQTIISDLLPGLQAVADAYLDAKEKSTTFATISGIIQTVFAVVVSSAAAASFVVIQFGQAIAATAVAIGKFINNDFEGAGAVFKDFGSQFDEASKKLDNFIDRVNSPKIEGGVNLFAGQDKTVKKPPAPRLAASGASDGTAELKKQLDAQIKLVEDFAKAQADAFQLGNTYLQGVYADGLISQKEFFDAQRNVRAAALAEQLAAIDKEIALQRAFAANPIAKQADRIGAEGKVTLLIQQRAEATTKASGVEIIANQQAARAVSDLADRYDDLRASVLANAGDDVGAAAIKNAQQLKAATDLVRQAQGDPAVVAQLKSQLDLRVRASELEKDYAKLLADTARAESLIYLQAQAGGKGELETLAAIRDARTVAIAQLQQQAAAAAELAAASGNPADIKRAEDLALALRKAAAEIDPLATKFNSLFEDSFSNAFAGFLTGAKSAKEAFRDFANSVISEIANIAAKNLAKSLFGDTGGSSGLGGFLSSLFKTSSSGSNVNTSGSYQNGSDLGFSLAVGTNRVPYDGFQATLHKDEAVVPARYNPAAGGQTPGGNLYITNNGAQVQAQRDDKGDWQVLIDTAADAGYRKSVTDLASGTGAASQALRQRHGVGAGVLPKRK